MAVESVTIIRRGMPLVVDLRVDVPKSETLAVMGPSGAGKTTLLRCIAGLTPLTSGMIRRTPGRLAMVFQDPRLLPWRTARQNVEFVLAPDDRHRAGEWLDRVGLGDAANEYPARLSGGMRQRVAIARALATRAQLILVDEPFSHLDALTAASLRVELSEHLASTGSTAIWITHDPTEAAAVAVRTLELDGPPNGGWRLQ